MRRLRVARKEHSLAIEQPTESELVIIGLTIPQSLQVQANVIWIDG